MIVSPLHPLPVVLVHNGQFTWDEFLCLGLIAVVLVVATFYLKGGTKEDTQHGDPARATEPDRSVKSQD